MKIKVPASTANLGCGFDSCGLAVGLYLTLTVGKAQAKWQIDHELPGLPHDEANLIIQTALELVPTLTPHRLEMTSEIPPARGLGSSSAAIVAGIELANQLGELHLSPLEKVNLATTLEGHPDNVAPAILGSFVVAAYDGKKVYAVPTDFPTCELIACIPTTSLLTSESRAVLPTEMAFQEGVLASSLGHTMVAAICQNDLTLAGKIMEEDRWHEPYRQKLVPHLAPLRSIGHQVGAFATYLSGAGPTVMAVCPVGKSAQFIQALTPEAFAGELVPVVVDTQGVVVE